MQRLIYLVIRFLIQVLSLIPYNAIYILSRFLYFILYYLIRYRRTVVKNNLTNSYIGLSKSQLDSLTKDTYRNLTEITIEGIKGLSFNEATLNERFKFQQAELIFKYINNNQSVIVANGHIGNWEWAVLQFGYYFKNKSIGIYKQIKNEYLNHYINSLRAKSTIQLLSTRETRLIAEEIPKGKIILLMGDQNPSNIKDAIWTRFLNQETACLHGIEKYAKQYKLPVIFGSIRRVKKGYYTMSFSLLTEQAELLAPGQLTQMYMAAVEQNIQDAPGNWLWTHRRWKHKREGGGLRIEN